MDTSVDVKSVYGYFFRSASHMRNRDDKNGAVFLHTSQFINDLASSHDLVKNKAIFKVFTILDDY